MASHRAATKVVGEGQAVEFKILWRWIIRDALEIDAEGASLTIVSGYGEHAQWYRNLRAHPDIEIRTGGGRRAVRAKLLSPEEGADVMAGYARRYPKMAPELMKLCGAHIDGTEADYREVAVKRLRFVQLERDEAEGRRTTAGGG